MELTAKESKWVEGLRQEVRVWPWLRWVLLTLGILKCGFSTYVLASLSGNLPTDASPQYEFMMYIWHAQFALLWPVCLLGWVIGGILIGFSLGNWHGNAQRMLLLKLLDAQLNQPQKEVHSA